MCLHSSDRALGELLSSFALWEQTRKPDDVKTTQMEVGVLDGGRELPAEHQDQDLSLTFTDKERHTPAKPRSKHQKAKRSC